MPDEWELVLDLDNCEESEERICYYYFVNCSNRSLFWFHRFDVTPLLCGLADVKTKRRIRESEPPASLVGSTNDPHYRTSIGKFLLVSLR